MTVDYFNPMALSLGAAAIAAGLVLGWIALRHIRPSGLNGRAKAASLAARSLFVMLSLFAILLGLVFVPFAFVRPDF